MEYYIEERPWGQFTILYTAPYCQVKELKVKPGHRLSYQMHAKRGEHWLIVQGEAHVTLNGEESIRKEGEHVDIPVGTKHRVANQGSRELIFIEVQTGSYFGEDDIVRLEDDYQRT